MREATIFNDSTYQIVDSSNAEFWERLGEIFPYQEYRKEQFPIIRAVANPKNKIIMIDAETGTGKTIAILSALLCKANASERILIFTKMLSQMDAWYRELGKINHYQQELHKDSVPLLPLVGKNHLCKYLSEVNRKTFQQIGCALFNCTYYRHYHFIRQSKKAQERFATNFCALLKKEIKEGISLSEILWTIDNKIDSLGCPYLSLRLALKTCPYIITTYPFLIQPKLHQFLREQMNFDPANTTIVIDEAHNLARSTIANLSFRVIKKAQKEIGTHPIITELLKLRKVKQLQTYHPDVEKLRDLEEKGKAYLQKTIDQGYYSTSSALEIVDFLQHTSNCYLAAGKKLELYLKNPEQILSHIKSAKQIILLSGTFRPLPDFALFLGVPDAERISIQSEFLKKHRIILTTLDPKLTSSYSLRTKERYKYYGEVIKNIIENIPGHVLVFTPNYEIAAIYANLLHTNYYEKPNQDISKLLSTLKATKKKEVIIAPARGKISEGIEIVRNNQSLIMGVIVAGLPYPPPTKAKQQLTKKYTQLWGEERAKDYLFYLQTSVAIRQCLGRMIRSKNDLGAWIILDNRIRKLAIFPKVIPCKTTKQLVQRLQGFFQKNSHYLPLFFQ